MRSFEVHLPRPKQEYASIFAVCCLHIGHKCHDKAKALDYRDYILRTPDTYAVSLGDDTDNALPGDEKHNSMMFDETMTPEEQYAHACDFWRPLAEKGKLLWTHDSNHWWRTEAKTGMSAAKRMNEWLGWNSRGHEPQWGQWQAMIKLHVGKQVYTLHSWHGTGGGKTAESALRRCRETASFVDADIYLMGHFHRKITYSDIVLRWDGAQPCEYKRDFGVTGSFLRWEGSYAERSGLPPAARGAIKLELSGRRFDTRLST